MINIYKMKIYIFLNVSIYIIVEELKQLEAKLYEKIDLVAYYILVAGD